MKKFLGIALILIVIQYLVVHYAIPHDPSHAADDHHGTPWGMIVNQAFNFTLVILFLVVATGGVLQKHFKARKEGFNDLVRRAESARVEAEKTHKEIKERLSKLESSASQNLDQAKAEAEELKQRIVAEAKTLSERLKVEAERTTQYELERAVAELRHDLLTAAVDQARTSLKENVGDPDQKRLQGEFVEKIQVVR